ncbi:hypothetical protein [Nocardia sp. NRRL S-836]|uniref:hypothetical protein n=1 Tax=Nocardia sp. NRRL S-836 TaxID=1519492 RepID=UPI0006AF505D|nr:hypothetical protein [Nocardia sp. NRRL S-836]KOV86319.1 hypothetical protein ADL03_09210 [Nocardia sp. NRRL S-836]
MPDRLHVLTAIYQSDRADRATTLTVSLATIGVATTYLIGTIAFYDKLDLLGWAISLLPFPMLCTAAFHSQLLNLAAVRARSVLTLERALLAAAGPDQSHPVDPSHVGATAAEHATNIHTAGTPHRLAMLIAYGGAGVIPLAYTVLMLIKAAHHLNGWVAVPAVFYLVLLVPITFAWRDSAAKLDFDAITSASGCEAG